VGVLFDLYLRYGLEKGDERARSKGKNAQLVEAAGAAVRFLEEQFNARNRRIHAVTGLGTPMRSIEYRSVDGPLPLQFRLLSPTFFAREPCGRFEAVFSDREGRSFGKMLVLVLVGVRFNNKVGSKARIAVALLRTFLSGL
jgi:hypothetical protein